METFQQQLLLHSGKARTTDATAFSISDIWSSLYSVPRPSGAVSYKQSAWDKVAVASEREILTNSVSDNVNKARLLVVMAPHSGDWLHALPLSNCGLRLDDSAVHIAVGLRLGANICEPHQCPCGALVDASGLHGLSCKGGTGRSARHHGLNDLIWRGEHCLQQKFLQPKNCPVFSGQTARGQTD